LGLTIVTQILLIFAPAKSALTEDQETVDSTAKLGRERAQKDSKHSAMQMSQGGYVPQRGIRPQKGSILVFGFIAIKGLFEKALKRMDFNKQVKKDSLTRLFFQPDKRAKR